MNLKNAPYFFEIAEAPRGGTAYWTHTSDGVRLRVGYSKPESSTHGTIFIFPGRTEYIEKYGRTITAFNNYGFATFVIDWRGQGFSDRIADDPATGHVARFADYHKDVAAMVRAAEELELPKPWFLVGHSLGACIGLRAIIDGMPVAAVAFTGPMWGINLPVLKRLLGRYLSWTASAIGAAHIYAPGTNGKSYVLSTPFEANRLTNDPEMYQYYIRQINALPGQQIGGPSMGWLFQTLQEIRHLSRIPSPSIPCIAFCGDQEQVVSISAIRHRMAQWPSGKLVILANVKHDIFSEIPSTRDNVVARICALFAAHGREA